MVFSLLYFNSSCIFVSGRVWMPSTCGRLKCRQTGWHKPDACLAPRKAAFCVLGSHWPWSSKGFVTVIKSWFVLQSFWRWVSVAGDIQKNQLLESSLAEDIHYHHGLLFDAFAWYDKWMHMSHPSWKPLTYSAGSSHSSCTQLHRTRFRGFRSPQWHTEDHWVVCGCMVPMSANNTANISRREKQNTKQDGVPNSAWTVPFWTE